MADRDAVKAKIVASNSVLKKLTFALTVQDNYYKALQKFIAARNKANDSKAKADALLSGANTRRL